MTELFVETTCSTAELESRRRPRTDIVAEAADGPGRWICDHGPFRAYERTLDAAPIGDDRWTVRERTRYRLAIPVWGWLFQVPIRRALRARQPGFDYWWAPPDRLDAHPATVLGLLAAVQLVDGYLGTVLTQTVTFAADEFGHGNFAQGLVLGLVRFGVLITLAAGVVADRRGRRGVLLATGIAGCLFTALGGLAPGLWFVGATQLVARGLSTALGVLIVIIAAEEMPARSRAWAASVLVLAAGLGSGMAVWVLPIADVDPRGWRAVYLAALLGVLVVVWAGRRLPETTRFTSHIDDAPATVHTPDVLERRRRRLVLLASSAFLLAMFLAPASGFQNDFLKDERGFDATRVTIFTLVTSTPAGIGVLIGGYMSETTGRRRVAAVGLVSGTVLATAAFFVSGPALWLFTLGGVVFGALAVPALAVYGPELFGTHDRGRANGVIVVIGVAGSAVGLLVAGFLSDRWGGELGPALALLAIGPLAVAALVITVYPETAGLELEDLNPEDA